MGRIVEAVVQVINFPLFIWNQIPAPIRIVVYIGIFLFAVVIAWLTWKYREAWRYVY